MRSLTSRPPCLRASWTSRTTSRTRPARRSSGVTVRSRATVSPPAVDTAQPSRGVSVTISSSACSWTVSPSTWTERPATRAAGSAAATAAATVAVRLPKRLPSARKFALTVTSTRVPGERLQRADVELGGDQAAELVRAGRASPGPTPAHGPAAAGSSPSTRRAPPCRGPPAAAPAPPASASAASSSCGRAAGHGARWTESGAPSSPANSASHTSSVTNGTNGAISRVSWRRQVCRVASAAGSPSQKRRRDPRT